MSVRDIARKLDEEKKAFDEKVAEGKLNPFEQPVTPFASSELAKSAKKAKVDEPVPAEPEPETESEPEPEPEKKNPSAPIEKVEVAREAEIRTKKSYDSHKFGVTRRPRGPVVLTHPAMGAQFGLILLSVFALIACAYWGYSLNLSERVSKPVDIAPPDIVLPEPLSAEYYVEPEPHGGIGFPRDVLANPYPGFDSRHLSVIACDRSRRSETSRRARSADGWNRTRTRARTTTQNPRIATGIKTKVRARFPKRRVS
jgi:hypothetical protein